jgi:hypothetical protein
VLATQVSAAVRSEFEPEGLHFVAEIPVRPVEEPALGTGA